MEIAIVTGASSGLGREYAYLLDGEGLDEIWLVARRRERLDDLADELRTRARIFALDLTDKEACNPLQDALAAGLYVVRYLIHAAGFGKLGSTSEMEKELLEQMVALNCQAAVTLTQIVLPYCQKGSHIAEICSCAAFQPLAYLNVYSATKVFVLHYSRALAFELAPRGITVSAVCPYWIRDTEFIAHAEAGINFNRRSNYPFASAKKTVACRSFAAIQKGRTVITPDLISTLDRFASWLLPQKLLMQAADVFQRIF